MSEDKEFGPIDAALAVLSNLHNYKDNPVMDVMSDSLTMVVEEREGNLDRITELEAQVERMKNRARYARLHRPADRYGALIDIANGCPEEPSA